MGSKPTMVQLELEDLGEDTTAIPKYIGQLEATNTKYEKALLAIKAHQEIMAGESEMMLRQMSVYKMACKALGESL